MTNQKDDTDSKELLNYNLMEFLVFQFNTGIKKSRTWFCTRSLEGWDPPTHYHSIRFRRRSPQHTTLACQSEVTLSLHYKGMMNMKIEEWRSKFNFIVSYIKCRIWNAAFLLWVHRSIAAQSIDFYRYYPFRLLFWVDRLAAWLALARWTPSFNV